MNRAILVLLLLSPAALSCNRRELPGTISGARQAPSGGQSVHAIDLPRYQVELPAGAGRETYAVACVSCHSSRYIAMQPPFGQNKWDEIVRKMIKTYGAPISEDQVPVIARYLSASRERDSNAWNTLSGVVAPAPIAPTIEPANDPVVRASDLRAGVALYAKSCASCHGPSGAGDGVSASALMPRPTDLTTHRYSTRAIAAALWNGVPGTAMPGFRSFSADQMRALITYSRQLAAAPQPASMSSDRLTQGMQLYAQNCAACHGVTGAGDGFASSALPRAPTDFRNAQPGAELAAVAIANGIPGSTMPQWKSKLTEAQRVLLADYVRCLYDESRKP